MIDHCPAYKLIFMDIEMPGINGFQTSKKVYNFLIIDIRNYR